jgi:hypothetical protein
MIKKAYLVPWISHAPRHQKEDECQGYKVFLFLEDVIEQTPKDISSSMIIEKVLNVYLGPVIPSEYIVVPYKHLPPFARESLDSPAGFLSTHISSSWSPALHTAPKTILKKEEKS